MRKVIVTEYISLDGVIDEPRWTAPYWNDEIAQFKGEEMSSSDMLLLGRITYEGFAKAWPAMAGQPGAEQMNSMPKLVASRTLQEAEWNATIIKGSIEEEVSQAKQQEGKNILIYGSADFAQTLMQLNLIDEYRLLVYPVVLGTGKRFFKDGVAATLKVVEAKSFSSGVVALIYHPASSEQE